MPKYKVEAIDAKGQGFTDVIDAKDENEANATLRAAGYHVTKISLHKDRTAEKKKKNKSGKTFSFGRVNTRKSSATLRETSRFCRTRACRFCGA